MKNVNLSCCNYMSNLVGALLFFFAWSSSAETVQVPRDADIVFHNGVIYTANKKRQLAEAVAIKDGRIVYVGNRDAIDGFIDEKTRVFDLNGAMLLPGFTDAHTHMIMGGKQLLGLDLSGLATMAEVKRKLRAYVSDHPELEVIAGRGFDLTIAPGGNPHKADLDEIEAARPVVLQAADGHNLWVNSRALELAGITKQTLAADSRVGIRNSGVIEVDPVTGEPTGTLREGAMEPLETAVLPKEDYRDLFKYLRRAIKHQHRSGYTAIIDNSVPTGAQQQAFEYALQTGALTLRTAAALEYGSWGGEYPRNSLEVTKWVDSLVSRRDAINHRNRLFLDANTIKIYLDGEPEGETAAMLLPYLNSLRGSDHRGELNIAPEILNEYVAKLDAAGFQVRMHALGDRAVRVGLDAIEAAGKANGSKGRRHAITHIGIIDPADIPRFQQLGVYADIQTAWAYGKPLILQLVDAKIGPERSRYTQAFRSLRDAGAVLSAGTDWPVEPSNPFPAIEIAVTSKDPYNRNDPPWHPLQTLTVEDMLIAYTINGARLMKQENFRGSIEVGKVADFIVIDQDILTIPTEDISETKVLLTMIEGAVVYQGAVFEKIPSLH